MFIRIPNISGEINGNFNKFVKIIALRKEFKATINKLLF